MKLKAIYPLLFLAAVSCASNKARITNLTRLGGYALGEKVELKFEVSGISDKIDSLEIRIFEKKTGYIYSGYGYPDNEDKTNYSYLWDGRKPDGSWPAGGPYWVFAMLSDEHAISDTVEIGLTD